MVTKTQLLEAIHNYKNGRSAWAKAIKEDAIALVSENIGEHNEHLALANERLLEKALLNGAENWKQYSYGGCAFCYDHQIAKHYCNPTELKQTRNGDRQPNAKETWLDVQARALYQANLIVVRCFNSIN